MKTLLSLVLIALAALIAAPTMANEAPKQDKKEKSAKEDKKGEKKDKNKKDDKAPKVKPYPLKTCIVTDNDLKSMGDPVSYIHEGQEVKFCCQPCEKKFLKEPAKYLEKLPKEPAKG